MVFQKEKEAKTLLLSTNFAKQLTPCKYKKR